MVREFKISFIGNILRKQGILFGKEKRCESLYVFEMLLWKEEVDLFCNYFRKKSEDGWRKVVERQILV